MMRDIMEVVQTEVTSIPLEKITCPILETYFELVCENISLPSVIDEPVMPALSLHAGRAITLMYGMTRSFVPCELRRMVMPDLAELFEALPPTTSRENTNKIHDTIEGAIASLGSPARGARIILRYTMSALQSCQQTIISVQTDTDESRKRAAHYCKDVALLVCPVAMRCPFSVRKYVLDLILASRVVLVSYETARSLTNPQKKPVDKTLS